MTLVSWYPLSSELSERVTLTPVQATIRICLQLVPFVHPDQLSPFLPLIIRTFASHASDDCRAAYYDLLRSIWEKVTQLSRCCLQVDVSLPSMRICARRKSRLPC